MSTTCLHSHTSIYSQLTLDIHIENTEQRLVTMSVSLSTQTGLVNIIIQILNVATSISGASKGVQWTCTPLGIQILSI